ncbi:MAG: transcription termination/antitermination protein NusG [Candidatus Cardinium sp.]|uniref:transcription termination/antitermination protein NusG n=1 Tax=Cardinium endosymbiont of Dermatophagoides farinae TaxID=2597823 RepID=UPI001182DB34|nr:transcription termination/antitermination protein NusG [Cardinium endosymbiont of Dermatophagoides farinae]TSJ80523.1 transcription termination/antitermination factor NusG [Cardinium endosymbiont of Dermatophagoides farinae]UWW96489.1 MAG: transcription termination/antitermination protein NusG [Candidatus Cardinium sp.]
MNALQWYVLKVVAKQEEKIKANLQAELVKNNLQSIVSELLIPYEKVYEVRAGKKYVKNRHLFPGYIFLQADLSNGLLVQLLKSITGALGFLGVRGWRSAPVPLSQTEVDRIIGKTNSLEPSHLKLSAIFSLGEVVEIIDGPFAGFSGKVQEIFEEKKTLNVVVKIFDERSTPVELSYAQVKKLF